MPASPAVPDALAPGLVGPLLSNGRTTLEHAMATLFSLAIITRSPDLIHWGAHAPLNLAGGEWQSGRVGAGEAYMDGRMRFEQ